MLDKFLITALLALSAASPDGGTAKPKPNAKQLGSPVAASDAGVGQKATGFLTLPDAGPVQPPHKLVIPVVDGGTRAPRMMLGTGFGAADAGTSNIFGAGGLGTGIRDGGTSAKADAGIVPAVKKAEMTPEVKALVDRMQAFYEGTQDFKASFTQAYTYKAFKRTQTSSGTVVFKKPALMRWEYDKPAKKTFVLAGDTVYAHDPDAMMLTVAAINTNQLSASVTFLWGKGKLQDEFSIAKVACSTCKGTLLELTPLTPDPRFQRVKLEVDPKSAQVLKSTVIDPDGSENAITFSGLTANTGVNQEHFKINPPEGTQVQDFRKQPQQ